MYDVMSTIPIDSLDDPRVALYRNLTDGDLAERGDLFMAEGALVVERLLRSDFETVSVLVTPARAAEFERIARPGVPIYTAPETLLQRIVGFKFHMGVLAVARQRVYTDLDRVLERVIDESDTHSATLLVLPQVRNAQNLGAIIRCAAAFGAVAVVLGERGTSPFFRYAVRVSMGSVFTVPLVKSLDLERDLKSLGERWGFESIATVLDAAAQPLSQVHGRGFAPRRAILLGSEDAGLEPRWVKLCDRRVTIPMRQGVDSLNVAMSAAVFLYELTKCD